MNVKHSISKKMITILSVVMAFVFLLFFEQMLTRNQQPRQETAFDEGWHVSVNGKNIDEVQPLPEYRFDHIKEGDRVVLTNHFIQDYEQGQTLTFLIYLSTVEVKIDDEVVYSYGQDYVPDRWLVGSGYHFINLPNDLSGKTIQITVEAREENAFTNIPSATMSPTDEVYLRFAKDNVLTTFVCVFLTLLGVVLTLVSAAAICYSRTFIRLLYIGVFSFLMGIWSMGNTKILQIFGVNLASNTTVEYLSLYFAPIAFVLLVADFRKDYEPWRRRMVYGAAVLLSVFAVVATVLHFTNVEHFPRLLSYFHLFGALSLILVAITGKYKKRKKDRSSTSLYSGIVILSVTVGLDLIRFNLQKYVMPDNEFLSYSVIPIGSLVFIVMLLISYIYYVYSILMDKAEQEWLTERAFNDELCGTFNRTKCNQVFHQLEEKNDDYAIVNLDLNGLKTINDTYGHAKGDELLVEFADILKTSFKDIGEIFRMGGDEFVVIIRKEYFAQIDQCLGRMVKLEKRRSSELPYVIDSSYGVAKQSECPGEKIEKVYSLADQRMYEMKTKKKINRRLR